MRAVLLACLSAAAALTQQPGHTCGDPSEGPVLGACFVKSDLDISGA
jgi:hypothetical protein